MNELQNEINKRAGELWVESNKDLTTSFFAKILEEGVKIQQEFDAITNIQESYCIDNFEEAKEFWVFMVKFAETRKWFNNIMKDIAPDGFCRYCEKDLKVFIRAGYMEESVPPCCDEAYEVYTHS